MNTRYFAAMVAIILAMLAANTMLNPRKKTLHMNPSVTSNDTVLVASLGKGLEEIITSHSEIPPGYEPFKYDKPGVEETYPVLLVENGKEWVYFLADKKIMRTSRTQPGIVETVNNPGSFAKLGKSYNNDLLACTLGGEWYLEDRLLEGIQASDLEVPPYKSLDQITISYILNGDIYINKITEVHNDRLVFGTPEKKIDYGDCILFETTDNQNFIIIRGTKDSKDLYSLSEDGTLTRITHHRLIPFGHAKHKNGLAIIDGKTAYTTQSSFGHASHLTAYPIGAQR